MVVVWTVGPVIGTAGMVDTLLTDDMTAVEPDMMLAGADDSRSVEESVHVSSKVVAFGSISIVKGPPSSRATAGLSLVNSGMVLDAVKELNHRMQS
jgi:hypothetical protein